MILDMLKKENVQILDHVDDWKEAITVSLRSLEEQGYVTPDYAKGIIDITNEMGPYYVLTDDVALIHGRPETGVLKKQLAVTVLRKPIKFSEDGKLDWFAGSVSRYGLRISYVSNSDIGSAFYG